MRKLTCVVQSLEKPNYTYILQSTYVLFLFSLKCIFDACRSGKHVLQNARFMFVT